MSGNPNWDNLRLAITGDGTNNSQTIIDSSKSPKTITAVGQAKISNEQHRFYSTSIKLNGSTDRLSIAASADWYLGNTWTVRWHMFPLNLPSVGNMCRIFLIGVNGSSSALTIQFTNQGNISCSPPVSGAVGIQSQSNQVQLNTWKFYEINCLNGNGMMFTDGVSSATPGTITTQVSASNNNLYIGYDTVGTVDHKFNGYLQDIEIIGNVAINRANYTPPSSPILIGPQQFHGIGTAKFTDGAIATLARVWSANTGGHLANVTPNQASGETQIAVAEKDVYITILKQGYRPLTHGPITLND